MGSPLFLCPLLNCGGRKKGSPIRHLFISKTGINWYRLKKCQADASDFRRPFVKAYAGYIRWLAPAYEDREQSRCTAMHSLSKTPWTTTGERRINQPERHDQMK